MDTGGCHSRTGRLRSSSRLSAPQATVAAILTSNQIKLSRPPPGVMPLLRVPLLMTTPPRALVMLCLMCLHPMISVRVIEQVCMCVGVYGCGCVLHPYILWNI